MEKIKAVITGELIEVYETEKEAREVGLDFDHEGEVFFVARNKFEETYGGWKWAVYQLMTVGNEEVI
jgi:hypothetical protein